MLDLTPTRRAVLLQEYLTVRCVQTFAWSTANCCHFAAGWLKYATGHWPLQDLPDTPTARAALDLVAVLGGTVADAVTVMLDRDPVPATLAQLGDVVLMPVPGGPTGEALGVCNGRTAIFVQADGEAHQVDMAACTLAWRLLPDEATA